MIILRRIESKDLDQLRTWRNDFRIYRWCRQNTLISKEDQEVWFKRQTDDRTMRMFAIDVKIKDYNDTTVGVCGLTDIDLVNSRAEFSLYIGPEYQGRGFASETLSTLFRYGFETLGLHSIWGETFDGNPALELFKRVGMSVDGLRRDYYYKSGKYINAYIATITRDEWNQRN